LTVRKLTAQTFDGKRLNLINSNDLEVRKQYQIEIKNRFATLENLIEGKEVYRALDRLKEKIRTSLKRV
jgi:hypothetical protein